MNVLVTTIVSLNPGDAAILQGTIEILRHAFGDGVAVTVLDRNGTAAARYYPWAEFKQGLFGARRRSPLLRMMEHHGFGHHVQRLDAWRLRVGSALLRRNMPGLAARLLHADEAAALREYLKADLVIASGGTYLVPHYNLSRPVMDYELALALGRPLVFFPQSLGPFTGTPWRQRLERVFAGARCIVVRDERSAEHLLEIGVPRERVIIAADAAFALAPAREESIPARRAGPPRVAISVREWRHFGGGDPEERRSAYRDAIAAAATHLVQEHGASVTFLSTCQGVQEYWTDDAVTAREIVDRMSPEAARAVCVDGRFRQPAALIEELTAYDAVIATRMHAAILAFCAGLPVLPVAYEFKTRELLRSMGLEQWVTDIDAIQPATFVDLTRSFMQDLPQLQVLVRRATEERRRSALRLAGILAGLVRPSGRAS